MTKNIRGLFILNCKMQSNYLSKHLQSFLVKSGNSIWLWGYWGKVGAVLAQVPWPPSWWPFWKDMPFASRTSLSNQPAGIWYSRWALRLPGRVMQLQPVSSLWCEFTHALLVTQHLTTLKTSSEHQICGKLWWFKSWIQIGILTATSFTPR